jgi:hydrogenase expression/formation protein HypC
MCLGDVARVLDLAGPDSISVAVGERTITVSGMLLDGPPEVGGWVLVHSGFALGRLTDDEAREALEMRKAAGVTR